MFKLSKQQLVFLHSHNWIAHKSWFPHVPLALAVALAGLLYLLPLIEHTLGLHIASTQLTDFDKDLIDLTLWGVPQTAIGVLLLILSLGLLWRLRTAWATSIILIVIILLFKLVSATEQLHLLRLVFDGILLLFLLPAYNHFNRHNFTHASLFALVSIIVFMGYAVFGAYRLGDQFDPPITDLTSSLYFIIVTISSVGFGDITPTTEDAQIFLISVIILGFTVISAAVGTTLVPAFMNRIEQISARRKIFMKRSNHYIIVGHSALASNTYHELINRGEQVTVILAKIPEVHKYADIDLVTGDGGDIDTLRNAGGEEAKAVLALLDDDSENAFVILAAKELGGEVKTVAAVNDVKNMGRIRRVHPYLVIAPQVLGGELLTMALTGEKVDSSTIMQRLMGQAELTSKKKNNA